MKKIRSKTEFLFYVCLENVLSYLSHYKKESYRISPSVSWPLTWQKIEKWDQLIFFVEEQHRRDIPWTTWRYFEGLWDDGDSVGEIVDGSDAEVEDNNDTDEDEGVWYETLTLGMTVFRSCFVHNQVVFSRMFQFLLVRDWLITQLRTVGLMSNKNQWWLTGLWPLIRRKNFKIEIWSSKFKGEPWQFI